LRKGDLTALETTLKLVRNGQFKGALIVVQPLPLPFHRLPGNKANRNWRKNFTEKHKCFCQPA